MSVFELVGPLRGRIGESDCELLRDEALAQPVNALTSFAYVVIGVAIIAAGYRRGRKFVPTLAYGSCLVGVGIGSVLFHGPQPAGSRILHDLPILLTVAFILTHDLNLIWSRARRPLMLFGVAAVIATGVTMIDPGLGAAATGVGVGAIAVLEFVVYRRRLRPMTTHRQRQGYVAIIGVTAVAASSWLLGRTDSPVCDPEAAFQLHGVWHVISALVFGIWWWLAFDAGPTARTDRRRSAEPVSAVGTPGVERNPTRES